MGHHLDIFQGCPRTKLMGAKPIPISWSLELPATSRAPGESPPPLARPVPPPAAGGSQRAEGACPAGAAAAGSSQGRPGRRGRGGRRGRLYHMHGAARGRPGIAEVRDERWGRRHGQEAEEQERGQVGRQQSSLSLRPSTWAAGGGRGERRCRGAESGPARDSRPRRRRWAGGARQALPGGRWPGGVAAEGPAVPFSGGSGAGCACGPGRRRRLEGTATVGVPRAAVGVGGGWRNLVREPLRCCRRLCARF